MHNTNVYTDTIIVSWKVIIYFWLTFYFQFVLCDTTLYDLEINIYPQIFSFHTNCLCYVNVINKKYKNHVVSLYLHAYMYMYNWNKVCFKWCLFLFFYTGIWTIICYSDFCFFWYLFSEIWKFHNFFTELCSHECFIRESMFFWFEFFSVFDLLFLWQETK